MKYKTTKRDIMSSYSKVIKIGYCNLQNLVNYSLSASAYTCGVYGWNADIYHVDSSTAICTGYLPFGNISPDYETVRKYEQAAEKIRFDSSMNYDDKQSALSALLADFVKEVA